jgi:predicted small integral membrane protein
MTSYIALSETGSDHADDVIFIRDGFAVLGFVVPLVWLTWHRLWLHAALYFCVAGLLAALVVWSQEPMLGAASAVATLGLNLFVGLEGGNWLAQSWANRNYVGLDVIPAGSLNEAEGFYASRFVMPPLAKPMRGFQPVSTSSLIL